MQDDVDISDQQDMLTQTSHFDNMDTNASENESGNDDDSSNSFGDDNCLGKETGTDYENIDQNVSEEIEEARI